MYACGVVKQIRVKTQNKNSTESLQHKANHKQPDIISLGWDTLKMVQLSVSLVQNFYRYLALNVSRLYNCKKTMINVF